MWSHDPSRASQPPSQSDPSGSVRLARSGTQAVAAPFSLSAQPQLGSLVEPPGGTFANVCKLIIQA